MSSWVVMVPTVSSAARAAAETAERDSVHRRVSAVRSSAAALAAVHSGDLAERQKLVQACRQTEAAIERATDLVATRARAATLENRLDVLRSAVVEHAQQDLYRRVRQDVRVAVNAAREAEAQRAAHAAASRATEKANAEAQLRANARAARAREARAQARRTVRAGCAELAACIPMLPESFRTDVAGELSRLSALAATDHEQAAQGLGVLQSEVTRIMTTARRARRRRNEMSARCIERLDAIARIASRPASVASSWQLRRRLAEILSPATPDDQAFAAVAADIEALAEKCEQVLAADEQQSVTEALMASLARTGYEVGRVTEGAAFVADGGHGLAVRFDVTGAGATQEVKAEVVRLDETPDGEAEAACDLMDETLARLAGDASLPFRLRENARRMPRPHDALAFVDASDVRWRQDSTPQSAVTRSLRANSVEDS